MTTNLVGEISIQLNDTWKEELQSFNKFPRIITPKRLSPPRPATIALSDAFALM
jgi:hypothetical protein